MKNLKVWQKLALIGLVFLIPLLAVAWLLALKLNQGIDFRRRELSGLKVASPLLDLVRDLQAYRAARHAALRTPGLEAEVDHRTAELKTRLATLSVETPDSFSKDEWRLLEAEADGAAVADLPERSWREVREHCVRLLQRPLAGPPLQDFDACSEVIDEIIALVGDVGDRSGLTLDPDLDCFYLQSVLLVEGPIAIEQLSRARALSIGLIWPGEDRDEVRALLQALLLLSTPDSERDHPLGDHRLGIVQQVRTEVAIDKARREPGVRKTMEELRLRLASVSTRAREELMFVLDGKTPAISPQEFPAFVSARLEQAYGLKSTMETTVRSVLSARLQKLRDTRLLTLALSGIAVLVVTLLGFALMRDITGPIGRLAEVARSIAEGKGNTVAGIGPREDEIGDLSEAFEHMLAEEKAQREALVENNVKLLEATERALTADRAKRDFLASMSHEIRTPLNGILPVTDLLADTALDDNQSNYLRTIRTSAEHLLTLVDDILDFSKIEAGRLELDEVPFELRELLGDAVQALAARATARGLELNFHVKPDVPDQLVGDPHRLRQIVINLVGNALKFTHEGEVSVLVDCENPASMENIDLRFRVRDTGIGISPEVMPRLFSAFEQADNSTTRQYGGSGLGLAITKRLVELMDGSISVESEPNQGTTFSFTARFGLAEADYEQTVWNDLPRVRVLAVDDNATNRLIVKDLLASCGIRTEEAARADEALVKMREALAAGRPFELVITDMMMPDLDGFGMIEQIRASADSAISDVKIIMLTSAARPEDAGRARSLGLSAIIAKPIRQAVLLDAIAEALGRARRSRQTARIDPDRIPPQRSLSILLVEDNATNQHVARKHLETWGHRVTTAADGVEAVDIHGQGGIDLILMDSQMPRMNGLEATTAIRRREKEGMHVPIIAMTANVVKGFREECFAAGMDGYVSKPIRREALVAEMARLIPDLLTTAETSERPVAMAESASVESTSPANEVFDRTAFLESLGGDASMLREVLGVTVREDIPRLTELLKNATDERNSEALEQAAHAIKGLAAELRAEPCRSSAATVEAVARSRPADFPEKDAADLRTEFNRLSESLLSLTRSV